METYIGIKVIKAEPMLKNDIQGYKVQYENDYVSWSRKDVFEKAYKKINGKTEIMEDESSEGYTEIHFDENTFAAPHHYMIKDKNGNVLSAVNFQEGALKTTNINGIFIEDLIKICLHRLISFQESKYSCEENRLAIDNLIKILVLLNKRKQNRKERGVLGTHKV